ncbi:g9692 [Coccomyxa viridis]|uniref:G9692 protein n=1 Tax=Coccomyxa viridis TaxID=1274662 RepID=A0ABP1GAK1_9CHLO
MRPAPRRLAVRASAVQKQGTEARTSRSLRNMAGAALLVAGLALFADVPAHAGDLQQQQAAQSAEKQAAKDAANIKRAEEGPQNNDDVTQGVANSNINSKTFK